MRIRMICPVDDGALAAILRGSLERHGLNIPGTAYFDPTVDHLSAFYLDAPGRGYFVVEDEEGRTVGGAGFAEYPGCPGRAELQKMYLADSAKGRGLGGRLIDLIRERAKAAGYRELYLETHHVLDTAVRLYQAKGFQPTEPPGNAAEHPAMDLFFVLPLDRDSGTQGSSGGDPCPRDDMTNRVGGQWPPATR